MNGEMLQSCRIVAASQKALQEKKTIDYVPVQYENSIVFNFLPQKASFTTKAYKATNVKEWFERCMSDGLLDLKLLAPLSVKDRGILGFSNATQNSIVCFYKNGKVTYFTAYWEFDSTLKLWNVTYTEHLWEDAPQGKPSFHDNTEEFGSVLDKIEAFAREIDSSEFAAIFHNAKMVLIDGDKNTSEIKIELPKKNYDLFSAASHADVFGAMGSWNDSPPYLAHEKGLETRYDELSAELLEQLRLAILYAINEW